MALDLIEGGGADLVASDLHSEADLEALDLTLSQLFKWDSKELTRLASINPKLILDGRAHEVSRDA